MLRKMLRPARLASTSSASGLRSTRPRHLLPTTLPEMRATYQETLPQRVSELEVSDAGVNYDRLFSRLRDDALRMLSNEPDEGVRTLISDAWVESYFDPVDPPIDAADTLFLGLRADVKYDRVADGVFEHRYIAWSKAQGRAIAQGGAVVSCERDGVAAAIPERWVYRMEVDFGDAWAANQIIEFRRATGSDVHQLNPTEMLEAENDLSPQGR